MSSCCLLVSLKILVTIRIASKSLIVQRNSATSLFKAISVEPDGLVLSLLCFEQIKPVLAVLLRMLSQDTPVATRAAYNLAYLVSNDTGLQEVACNMGALAMCQKVLNQSYKMTHDPYPGQGQLESLALLREVSRLSVKSISGQPVLKRTNQSILLAVASLSFLQEPIRKQVVEADLLPLIVRSLSDTSPNVRSAACQCARALSRSLNVLRTHLVDAGASGPLLDLLNGEESDLTRSIAAATIANLLIEYSPMKEVVLLSIAMYN